MQPLESKLSTTKKFIFFFTLIFIISTIFFIFDYFYTNYLRAPTSEMDYRIPHKVYHHTLASSFNGYDGWGHNKYKVCTDKNGFKSSCDKINSSNKNFDIGFIGDSFTEGIGMLHENTFVGKFASNKKNLKIANLAVASYNPTIYLAKLKWLLDNGYSFKHIYVFIDISDIQDESRYSVTSGGIVISEHQAVKPDSILYPLKEFVFKNFKLFYVGFRNLKKLHQSFINKEQEPEDLYKLSRSEWTYNLNSNAYGLLGVEGSIQKALKNMTELHKILTEKNISLSIGIYPWPAQLKEMQNNKHKTNLQVSIWKKFCEKRCANFTNLFPKYKNLVLNNGLNDTYKKYFILGDIHYNELGNQLISDSIIYKN